MADIKSITSFDALLDAIANEVQKHIEALRETSAEIGAPPNLRSHLVKHVQVTSTKAYKQLVEHGTKMIENLKRKEEAAKSEASQRCQASGDIAAFTSGAEATPSHESAIGGEGK